MSKIHVYDGYNNKFVVDRRHLLLDGHKYCPLCDSHLPEESFNQRSASPDGLQFYCRVCERDKRQAPKNKVAPK